uniref:Zonadhesin-like n=1 Tax=Petromyzon marinus TaxID=7757 RepID=A0AAJ7WMY0_PETMA|nr:zonadhesin-like [Petromyzon marinus]
MCRQGGRTGAGVTRDLIEKPLEPASGFEKEGAFLVEGVRGHTDGSDIALDNFCVKVCDPRDICSTTPTPPPRVSATCHVAGDPHYFTFDSALITYMGTCTYQLVSVCNADNVTPFTILAKNEERGQPNASYLKHVYVDIGSDRIHLKKKNVILLNGKKVKTPMIESLVPGVQFSIIGSYVHVVTDFGLVIKFDGVHHLSITLSSAYANKVIAVFIVADLRTSGKHSVHVSYTCCKRGWKCKIVC